MRARFVFLGAAIMAGALVACGGGGGGGGTPITPRTSTPSPSPTATSASVNVTLQSAPSSTAVPAVLGITGSLALPGGSGSLTILASQSNPAAVTALQLAHPIKRFTSVGASAGGYSTVVYLTATATSAVTMDGIPGFSIAVPGGTSTAFYLAEYLNGFWVTVSGPSTVGSTVTIPATTSPIVSLGSGQALYFAVYSGGVLPVPNPAGCVGVQADSVARGEQPAAVGVQPNPPGASFAYSGTLAETIARSSPCPVGTLSLNATVQVTVSASPDPNNASYTDEDSTETDNYTTNSTVTNTTAVTQAGTSGSAATLNELSETSTDLSGDKTVTAYGGSGLAYAVTAPIPYTGASISNAPPSSVDTTLANGSSNARTYTGSTGAYSETDTIAGGATPSDTISVNADGAATYDINSQQFASQQAPTIGFAYSAPSGGSITLTLTIPAGSATGAQTISIPAWYSGPLYSDTTVGGAAQATLPAQCPTEHVTGIGNVAPLTRTITAIDPALGTQETRTITSWIATTYASGQPAGPVCVTISDTQKLYYDYFLDTPAFYYYSFDGNPFQVDTIAEAYDWSTAPTNLTRVRTLSAQRSAAFAGLEASIASHSAGIDFARATQRARRIELIDKSIAIKGIGGIK